MGNDVKEENNAPRPPAAGEAGGNNNNNRRGGGRRGARNRWNNATAGGAPTQTDRNKFKSRNKDIPEDVVFDNTGPNDAANFQHAVQGMADYLHTTYSADVGEAIRQMKDITITLPDPPTPTTDASGNTIPISSTEEYRWKLEYSDANTRLKTYNTSMPKAYIHIYNQCSTNLKNDLGTSSAYPKVNLAKNPVELLKLIQGLCCSFDSKTQSVMATIASQKLLFTYYQKDGVSNTDYHREFMAHVETIETYGGFGAVGIVPTFVTQELLKMATDGTCSDPTAPTDSELATAKATVRDEFLAGLMLSGANYNRYNLLRYELANQYGFGNDLYPKTVDQCLTMLNRRKDAVPRGSRNQHQQQQQQQRDAAPKQEDEALVFAQGADSSGQSKSSHESSGKKSSKGSTGTSSSSSVKHPPKITKVFCKNCGKLGHMSTVCPELKPPPAQIHAMATGQDDASDSSDDESVIILTQYDEAIFTQDSSAPAARRPINSDLLLLDSQSTVHLFSDPEHVTNIRPAQHPIRVHCNKGTLDTTEEANFGTTPVYYDSRGIANVLSLHRLGQKFRVTYDSNDRGGVFQVHTNDGVVEFTPTDRGLHALNLRDNPHAAYMLVNDGVLSPDGTAVATVRSNFEGFTKQQIKQAVKARRLMGMIGAPTEREYQGLVRLNLIKDCPITNSDIIHANKIFGPDLANIRGKTVRRKPDRVRTDYVDIPRVILDVHRYVTLVADVMFVNKVPFLVSCSRNLNLITIEHVPSPKRTASKLGYLLQRIIRVYARAGFTIQTILMDNEFEKVRDHILDATMNTPAASEHVGEIERKIRVIKERSRGIICTLPYTRLPQQMLIHLLHHVVMWLNNFPVKGGVSDRFSPRELILRHSLDVKRHCRAPFGAYCETHEDNTPTNSMKTRGMPSICLGPTGNRQGTYNFLSLTTGLVTKRRQFDEMPAPESVIQRVNSLSSSNSVSSTLVFADRHRVPYAWPDNTTDSDAGLDPTPIASYPDVPAEMPGILLERHQPTSTTSRDVAAHILPSSDDIDWSKLADEAITNADLTTVDHLPPPPDVFEISDDDNDIYAPPTNTLPLAKPELTPIMKVEPDPQGQLLPDGTQPRRSNRAKRPPDRFKDYVFTTIADESHLPPPPPYRTAGGTDVNIDIQDETVMAMLCHYVMTHTATALQLAAQGQPTKRQYSLKAGLRQFGQRADDAVKKELQQFHTMSCFKPRDIRSLSREDRRNALSSLMFLTEKRTGAVKARACANGSVQRSHIAKEEAAAPTVSSDAIFVQATIFAHEKRDVATCDIPGAFLQADNPDFVLMRLDGILAELMVQVDPKLYRKYITTNTKGKPVLYVELEKAVYGMMKSALLFYRKLVADLTSIGFTINPYDPCVANKIVHNKQMTVCWHVDDLFIGHEDPEVISTFLNWLGDRYDTADKKLNIVRGPKHDYLGMNLDFSTSGEVKIDMKPYVAKIISSFPEKITGVQATPASDHLFQIRPEPDAKLLPEEQARAFHHTTAQLLFLSRVRRDIQTTVAFLTTRVKRPDEDDWGKLKRVLKYLSMTRFLDLTLFADSLTKLEWYVDASHQIHDDCKGHTGSILTFGRGATTSSSTKQKIPSKSSCESEIIGLYDKVGDVLWTRQFLEAQGYKIDTNIVYQDNMSTLSLAKNGYVSSSKRTKHIKAKYFFVRHFHHSGELDLQYCPTETMWADVLTKPLQGAKFRLMRAFLMNCPIDYHEETPSLPTFTPSVNPTLAPTAAPTHKPTLPSYEPTDTPTPVPMKHRSLRPNASSRGCVETPSQGTKVPRQHCTKTEPTDLTVSWRDSLFPRHLATTRPVPALVSP